MAWTEQCKIAFKVNADALVHKNGGKGVVKVLKKLSKESDVPFRTLKNWYYGEKKIHENVNPSLDYLCPMCEIRRRERKKVKGEWYYYPECSTCRRNETMILLSCPHCKKDYQIKRRELKLC